MESRDLDHAARTLQAAIERFVAAQAAVAAAVAHRQRELAAAERRLRRATGGVGTGRVARAAGRRRINTTAEAIRVARALRSGVAAQAAVSARRSVEVAEAERVRQAEAELTAAVRSLRSLGTLGQRILGEARSASQGNDS